MFIARSITCIQKFSNYIACPLSFFITLRYDVAVRSGIRLISSPDLRSGHEIRISHVAQVEVHMIHVELFLSPQGYAGD